MTNGGDTSKDAINLSALFLIAIVGNLGSLLFGYDFGATSWTLVGIENEAKLSVTDDSTTNYYVLVDESSGLRGLIAAGASIGALITYLVLLFLGNDILKKDEILLAACLFFSGLMLESTSGQLDWSTGPSGLVILLVGRLTFGAGAAASFHATPQYISELGPKNLRGMVGSITEAMIVTGVVLGFGVGYFYQDDEDDWVIIFRVGYCLAVLMGGLALFIPHSPSGLVKAGHGVEDVLECFKVIHPNATEEDINLLMARRDEERMEFERYRRYFHRVLTRGNLASDMDWEPGSEGGVTNCCEISLEVKVLAYDPKMRRCLMLAILLVVLQIGTGQGVLLYFSGDIFQEICPESYDECILAFGGVKLVSAYVMVAAADLLGRREYLVYGTAVMVAGMVTLTVAFTYRRFEIALSGLFISVAGYEAGLGSFMWVLLSEIFPRFTRSASNSIAVSVLFLASTILTFSLPYFLDATGLLPIFIVFTIFGAVAVVALFLFAPETAGVELEEAYKGVDVRCRQSGLGMCCGAEDDEDRDQDVKSSMNMNMDKEPSSSTRLLAEQ